MIQVAGMGLLMGQHMAQPLRRGQRRGSQVNCGPEQPEQARGGQSRLHQIHRQGAVFHRAGLPVPMQPHPEARVHRQQEHRRQTAARQPDQEQHMLRRQPFILHGGVLRLHHPHRLPYSRFRVPWGHIRGSGVLHQRRPGHRDIHRLRGDGPGYRPLHRFGGGKDGKVHRRQAHRHQQPHQDQSPQGVLHPAGQGVPKQLSQPQQCQNQHRRGNQNFSHGYLLPSLSPKWRTAHPNRPGSASGCPSRR